eukprot:jgi/Botrbrau1/12422/Bobra.0229s0018.1
MSNQKVLSSRLSRITTKAGSSYVSSKSQVEVTDVGSLLPYAYICRHRCIERTCLSEQSSWASDLQVRPPRRPGGRTRTDSRRSCGYASLFIYRLEKAKESGFSRLCCSARTPLRTECTGFSTGKGLEKRVECA